MPKNYMIGNWKMNQSLSDIQNFFSQLKLENNQNNFWITPQSVHISECLKHAPATGILIGAQNCSHEDFGAFTGEIACRSLAEIGAHFTLIGHSERRSLYGETDQDVNQKAKKAISEGLIPVICVGETLAQRDNSQTLDVVLSQVKNALVNIQLHNESEIIIAYEPVWAIGTGKTATPQQAEEVHAQIRNLLIELYPDHGAEISLLYGGSVKPANIKELLSMQNINGGLVGGASLKPESFSDLCKAC